MNTKKVLNYAMYTAITVTVLWGAFFLMVKHFKDLPII